MELCTPILEFVLSTPTLVTLSQLIYRAFETTDTHFEIQSQHKRSIAPNKCAHIKKLPY